ncbi:MULTISPECIES: type II CRISPR-associated endonuclease Cas1 [unclassified Staphylococcus]|uniref:type II CRISPR-associated endonuclease Cas1 n=1 Tax=unclassified Staphylococcus TaxID=91994 RepID=UPI0021D01564|nr:MULTISPECIES: type II CRISPR-associated endonuclease Cas1 [unclassified Staphylococcus]
MGWRVVYISDVDKLSLHLDSLKIKKGDDEYKVPLNDIYALVIEDLTISLTSRLIVALSNHNILVIFCNQKHLPECVIHPISGHFNQYSQMKNQLMWDEANKEMLWREIVKQKIHNQIHCMKYNAIVPERIEKMISLKENVLLKDRQNIEGQAAKYYFNSFFKDFTRDDETLVENAVLNYGYTILNAAIARTIVAKGLIPAMGIHHIGGRNHFNLASDFLEPFRPVVDLFLLKCPPEEYLTRDYRLQLVNLIHAKIYIDGKLQTVIRAIEIMVQSIIDYFKTGNLDCLKFPDLHKYEFYEL